VLRMPSQLGSLFMEHLTEKRHPFGILVVADPFKAFDRKSCGHPGWRLLRWRYTRALRSACRNAAAVAYVTSRSLQTKYPPGGGFVTDFSDVVLTDAWFIERPRRFEQTGGRCWNLVHVGTFNQPYKAQDTLLNAIALCREAGISVRATLVGGGRYRQGIESLASSLRLDGVVTFAGDVPLGAAIRKHLDNADLFVLPSRTEGLPRALLEAMARGLPCLASDVGGIPELLDSVYLVPPDRPDLLFRRIAAVLSDPGSLTEMSARNLSVARQYHWTNMAPRRRAFLDHLRCTTEEWLRKTA
jgi:glycosyltransferase involved in cell wall biosynthesis